MTPNKSSFITLSLYDYDMLYTDEIIGSFKLSISTVNENAVAKWANIYGAP